MRAWAGIRFFIVRYLQPIMAMGTQSYNLWARPSLAVRHAFAVANFLASLPERYCSYFRHFSQILRAENFSDKILGLLGDQDKNLNTCWLGLHSQQSIYRVRPPPTLGDGYFAQQPTQEMGKPQDCREVKR